MAAAVKGPQGRSCHLVVAEGFRVTVSRD